MKVLIDVNHSFAWAHGGVQVLVEHLLSWLPRVGVEVEPLRWWDSEQSGDIIHTFYKPGAILTTAKDKGYRIVSNIFLDYLSSNGAIELAAKQLFIPLFKKVFPNYGLDLGWFYGQTCDAYIYPSSLESHLGERLFGADCRRSHVILHGVDVRYFTHDEDSSKRGDYLISIATIHPRKNSLLLAQLARELQIPIVFLGKAYSDDGYYQSFRSLVDNRNVIYKSYVDEDEKGRYLSGARGFVLLSTSESGCIAVLEALAAGCPVLLSDLPWARSLYDEYAVFAPLRSPRRVKEAVRRFYDAPEWHGPKFPVETWDAVAQRYRAVYEEALRG